MGNKILESVKSLGGKAKLQQIYERLPGFKPLAEKNKRITKWGEPAYQHQIRAYISKLWHKKGKLVWVSKGCYSLTKKGIERIDIEKRRTHSQRLTQALSWGKMTYKAWGKLGLLYQENLIKPVVG